jgi:hypothetical protein
LASSVPAPVSARLGKPATCLGTRDLQTGRDHSILDGPTHSQTLIPFRANVFRQLNWSPMPSFWHDSSADPVVAFSIRPSLIAGKSQPYKPLIYLYPCRYLSMSVAVAHTRDQITQLTHTEGNRVFLFYAMRSLTPSLVLPHAVWIISTAFFSLSLASTARALVTDCLYTAQEVWPRPWKSLTVAF